METGLAQGLAVVRDLAKLRQTRSFDSEIVILEATVDDDATHDGQGPRHLTFSAPLISEAVVRRPDGKALGSGALAPGLSLKPAISCKCSQRRFPILGWQAVERSRKLRCKVSQGFAWI
jgi:hypothetical protein